MKHIKDNILFWLILGGMLLGWVATGVGLRGEELAKPKAPAPLTETQKLVVTKAMLKASMAINSLGNFDAQVKAEREKFEANVTRQRQTLVDVAQVAQKAYSSVLKEMQEAAKTAWDISLDGEWVEPAKPEPLPAAPAR